MTRFVLALAALAALLPRAALAATQVKTAVNATSISGTNWGTPANIQGDDGAYATYNNTGQNFLIIKTFGFSLPAGATVDGIDIVVNGNGSQSQTARRQFRAALTKDGAAVAGTEKTGLQFLQTTDSNIPAGSSTDKWGTTWTQAEVNSANFGLLLRDNDATAHLLNFDHAVVTVHYTPAATVTVTPTDVAPGSLNQDAESAFLKLSLVTDQSDAQWTALRVTKSGTLADAGVTTVKVYLDTGNGTYGAEDTLVSGAVNTFSAGIVDIALTAQTINTTPKVYWVVYDLAPGASPGSTIGASIAQASHVTITSPDTIAATNLPANSSNATVADVADTVTVTRTNMAPASTDQGTELAFERLSLATNQETATWTALKVTKLGTLADSYVTTVKLYLDDGDNVLDAGDTLVSPAANTFSAGTVNITLSAAQTITTTAKVYHIVYQLAADATVGATIGARVNASADVTLTAPDLVSGTFPLDSTTASINDVADTVTVTPADLAPVNAVQGVEYAMEKLSLATGGDQASWTAITVTKSGTLPDGDVTSVKIYRDTGNGTWGAEDALISPAVNTFTAGSVAITLSAAQTITTSAQVYFIVYAIGMGATPGGTIGARLASNAAITVSSPDLVASTNFPVQSSNATVVARGDVITVTPASQAPGNVNQDAEYSVLRLSMATDANTAQWTAINVGKSGTAPDAAVTSVKIYLDDGDNAYDAGDTLISPAVTTFSGGAAAITLTAAQTITTTAKVYFIVYDLAADAQAGATIGASVGSQNDLTVTSPDTVASTNFPASSANSTIDDVADTVTVTPTDAAPASAAQGSEFAPLKLSMATGGDQATWTSLTVTKTGTLADGSVTTVKVYYDDGDGSYDAGDTLISPAVNTFTAGAVTIALSASQTLTTTPKAYFIVYGVATLATIGDTLGARVTANTDVTVSGVDAVASTNFPASSSNAAITDGADTLTVTPTNLAGASVAQDADYAVMRLSMAMNQETATWTALTVTKTGTAADSAVDSVKVYLDDGDLTYDAGDTLISPAVTTFSGGSAAITLSAAQTLTTAAKVYFIVYDLDPEAAVGATVGASLSAASAVTLTAPDLVSSSNFPASTTNSAITDLADTITVTPTNTAPASISQGETYAPLKLSMATAVDQAVWTAITVTKTGNLADNQVATIRVYLDDGDGSYDAEDTLVSPAANTFTAGSVAITLSASQTINTTAKVYFIVYQLSLTATVGNTIGAQVTSNASLTVTAPDSVASTNFPMNSSNSTVAPANVVTVTPTSLAPASIGQGAEYPVEKLALATDADTAVWTALRLNKTGTLARGSVSAVRVYLDDGSGVFGPEDTQIGSTVYGGGDTVNLTLSAAQTITTTAKTYFVVHVLAAAAAIGNTVGVNIAAATDFTITAPDYAATTNIPVNSGLSTVAAPEIAVSLSTNLISASVDVNTEYVIPNSVTVTNAGNVPQTYDLKAQPTTAGTPWTIGTARNTDVFVLQALVNPSQPPTGDFGAEDRLDNAAALCTSTVFARGGAARCDRQTVGGSTVLWFKIGMPTITSTEAQQDIQVTVTANQ